MIQLLAIVLGAQKSKMDQRGASAVEYGLLVSLIAVAIIAAVIFLGGALTSVFDTTSDSINGPTAGRTGAAPSGS